jgi:hypothetical protein
VVAVDSIDTITKRCPIHDIAHRRIEQCPQCRAAAAGTARDDGPPKADVSELEKREREYRDADTFLRGLAHEWLTEGTAQERSIAIKAFDAASKWARLSYEIRQQRIEIEHDQWLRDQKARLGGGGN